MKRHRFYHPAPLVNGNILSLSDEVHAHAWRVLRLTVGEEITLFNGENQEANAIIRRCDKQGMQVELVTATVLSRESPLNLHLLQALSKGERFDWVVQKAVELGVSKLTPLLTQRTVVRVDDARMAKKMRHWQEIIVNASAQCGRNRLMQLQPVMALSHWSPPVTPTVTLILEANGDRNLPVFNHRTPVQLIVGPEGGFSEKERQQLPTQGIIQLALGPRILRTETAAIVACALMQTIGGDLSVQAPHPALGID